MLTDVSVAFPQFVNGRYKNSGPAREAAKIQKYRVPVAALDGNNVFRPLVVDGFGRGPTRFGCDEQTCASQCVVGQTFSCPRFFKRHHWRILSVTIMRALC